MAFTSVEIIALIVLVAATIKILMLAIKPAGYMKFAKAVYKRPAITRVIAFILAGVVLYYLINSGLTIVQILATTAFVALLIVIGLAGDVKDLLKKYQADIKAGKLWKRYGFYTLLWVALMVWGALVLFKVI